MNKDQKKVISASRRIDMVGTNPDQFVDILNQKCPPERVHTLVIWTKNATNLFEYQPLYEKVKQYDQLFIHYTVTGMGATFLEPRIESPLIALEKLPALVELVKSPRRIRFRFDPIVHFRFKNGDEFTNLNWFERIAPEIQKAGISEVSISWMAAYKKVVNRLGKNGIQIVQQNQQQWQTDLNYLQAIVDEYHLNLQGCCVPQMSRSRCIDGHLFNELHPFGKSCSTKRAKGQRKLCGCTESWDIGWYSACVHGCLYCYANPIEIPGLFKKNELMSEVFESSFQKV